MAHQKAGTDPVRDKGPVKTKPGDFEPPLNTKDPIVIQPPAEGPQSATTAPRPKTREAESRR